MAEERDRTAVAVGPRREDARRVDGRELAHLDAALRGEHVLLEAMGRELVEIAFGVLHREKEESDVVMRDEIQRRGQQHTLPYRAMRSAAAEGRRQNHERDQDALHTHRPLDQWRLGGPT